MKDLIFEGDSRRRLKEFPSDAREDAGFALYRVQQGEQPFDFKPFASIGKGVEEIRVWDESGTYRIVFVARFAEAVYVLHCFKKTTEKTAQRDIDLATERFVKLQRRRVKDGL